MKDKNGVHLDEGCFVRMATPPASLLDGASPRSVQDFHTICDRSMRAQNPELLRVVDAELTDGQVELYFSNDAGDAFWILVPANVVEYVR